MVLFPELLQLAHLIDFQSNVLFLPSVESLLGNPHPPDQFHQWDFRFRLLQNRYDLFDVESFLLPGKISLPQVLDFAGN
jgi:hypothetical protein